MLASPTELKLIAANCAFEYSMSTLCIWLIVERASMVYRVPAKSIHRALEQHAPHVYQTKLSLAK